MTIQKPVLLIVDDDPAVLDYSAEVSRELGFDAKPLRSGKHLLDLASEAAPSAVLLDVVMPDMDGLEVLQELADRNIKTSVILMSGYREQYLDMATSIGKARGLTIIGTLRKPFSPIDLKNILQKVSS